MICLESSQLFDELTFLRAKTSSNYKISSIEHYAPPLSFSSLKKLNLNDHVWTMIQV